MTPATRYADQHHFRCGDGTELFYRHWPAQRAAAGAEKRAIVLFHRGHEHSGRLQHLVDELELANFDFFAWDARGHGLSPGARGFSPSFGTSVHDCDVFVRHLAATHGVAIADMAVVAQSVGAVLAAAWAHDYAPEVRALVLASPAFSVKLYVPFARPGLALLQKLRGQFFVNSYVKAKFLTHDPERQKSYDTDPLIARAIASNILLELYDTAERVVADAAAIRTPTLLLISASDWVVRLGPQRDFFEKLGSPVKEKIELDGFYHDTLGEKDRAKAIAPARAFLLKAFERPPAHDSLLEADRRGFTHEEYEKLAAPLPWYSPKKLYWGMTRATLRFGALLSRGLELGEKTGYDSGSTLDYVYRHHAQGFPLIGTLIDKVYLESIGWRGIRVRKRHLERLIAEAAGRLRAAGEPLRVVDIAAGHGRYVLDALGPLLQEGDQVLLRDYSELNVEQGRALIAERGLGARVRFEKGDAFDEKDLAALEPRPNLAIVSGLYELFPDNGLVGRSLAGLGAALAPGGQLLYTGQPWHPQLELIARGLTSHRDLKPWVMRRRSQAELDQLVAAAGFEKVGQLADDWGIFTVSAARRVSPT